MMQARIMLSCIFSAWGLLLLSATTLCIYMIADKVSSASNSRVTIAKNLFCVRMYILRLVKGVTLRLSFIGVGLGVGGSKKHTFLHRHDILNLFDDRRPIYTCIKKIHFSVQKKLRPSKFNFMGKEGPIRLSDRNP